MINRIDFPFLETILWDTRKTEFTPEELFYYIEKRFRYIDIKSLYVHEYILINELKMSVGKGVILC